MYYMKYFSYCLLLLVSLSACNGEVSKTEEAKAVLAEAKTVAATVVADVAVADSTTNAVANEENAPETTAETTEKESTKSTTTEKKVETKEERLKREQLARRAKRKAKREKEAARRKAAKNGPKMDFSKTSYKFGTIMQGDEVEHVFKFKNTGKKDLVISNVTVTCGCTHPSYPFVPIAPGEDGEIKVHYNSAGKLGPQKPTVTVISNAYPTKQKIYMEGFVDAERAKPIKKDSL
ncbi:MAG: DUF1573 domain-containing protein [Saprospiraceae bacterium]